MKRIMINVGIVVVLLVLSILFARLSESSGLHYAKLAGNAYQTGVVTITAFIASIGCVFGAIGIGAVTFVRWFEGKM